MEVGRWIMEVGSWKLYSLFNFIIVIVIELDF
jgi:hypothetical protein